MDYEKKYNEALEKARYVLHTVETAGCVMHKDLLEEIFPELAESEDERIRKKLYNTVMGTPNDSTWFDGTSKEAMLAWLEKQKYDRMKPIYDARESFESALEKAWNDYHNGYENVDKLEDDYVECAHAKGFREGYLFGIEKQKEQKPTNDGKKWIFEDDYQRDLDRHRQEGYEEGYEKGLKEQKPVKWSEEDKKKLYQVIETILADKEVSLREYPLCKSLHEAYDDMITFLKSLRPQPKQEWSEEDETHLGWIIECFDSWKYQVPEFADQYQSAIDWLKSLRPTNDCNGCSKHLEGYISGMADAENKLLEMYGILLMPDGELRMKPRWKPSEEQMEALRRTVNKLANTDVADSVRLSIIYDNLNKL